MAVMNEVEGREERWIKYYSSAHAILLVGEGDFSFSLCLAMAFGSATNIVATSLESYDELIKRYENAEANLAILKNLGAVLMHRVDATHMKILQYQKFHRIIFNFPHAGFYGKEDNGELIRMHRNLVHGFLWNASRMLYLNGEIHVNHKTKYPYNEWRIEELASDCCLIFVGCAAFSIKDYPGYNNKRGAGPRCDMTFELGECGTFKYKLDPFPKKILEAGRNLDLMQKMCPTFQNIPVQVQQHPILFDGQQHSPVKLSNECHLIFGGFLRHVEETFGITNYAVHQSVNEALRVGFTTYNVAFPGRSLSGYIEILEELHHLSMLRSHRLQRMLSRVEQQL